MTRTPGFARVPLVAAALLAVVVMFLASTQAQAQTQTQTQAQAPVTLVTLVQNTGQSAQSDGTALDASTTKLAQGFHTGSHARGYRLTSVHVRFHGDTAETDASKLTATINVPAPSGDPGTAICTLTNPSALASNSLNQFTVPDSCRDTGRVSRFFLVIERTDSTGGAISLSTTGSGAEDVSVKFWSLDDDRRDQTSSGWTATADSVHLMKVTGHQVPAPPSNVTLLKNTGQTATGSGVHLNNSHLVRSQPFKTGSDTAGYNLTSVALDFKHIGDTANAAQGISVSLYTDRSGSPDQNFCTLEDPPTFSSSGVHRFTNPRAWDDLCPQLDQDTEYHILIRRNSRHKGEIRLQTTTATAEDTIDPPTSLTVNDSSRSSESSRGGWNTDSTNILMVDIKGGPSASGLAISSLGESVGEGDYVNYQVLQPAPDSYVDSNVRPDALYQQQGTYHLSLTKNPAGNVRVNITVDPSEGSAHTTTQPSHLDFTTTDWWRPQVVAIRGSTTRTAPTAQASYATPYHPPAPTTTGTSPAISPEASDI